MKILNLYAGIGGNRALWGDEHEVTAVELNPELAAVYKERFPQDEVIVGDAQEYLMKHYAKFDFIWSSPPCQTHSSFRFNIGVRYRGVPYVMPDMKLYQEIIFLRTFCKDKKWVVENVKPYYDPLIEPQKVQRHCFWANFKITDLQVEQDKIRTAQIPQLQELHGVDLSNHKIKDKRQVLRNCVHKEVGLHVLKCAIN